jgi:pyruvate ferredoxin oxidoreductase alpha subunit
MKKNTKYQIQDTKYSARVRAMTGGYAVAEALKQINPDVMAVYPITPQTPIIETFAKMKADGIVDTEIVQVESEHSAISATIGACAAGARAVTATSSQGLMYMAEILPIASGLRLPIVMCVSSRSLSAPINIHGEHGDVMAARGLGWIQIFAENVQEAYDNIFIATKLAETVDLPVMPIMDGFHTSHTTERIEICQDGGIKKFVGERKVQNSLTDFENPVSFGALALQNSYFEFKLDQEKAMREGKMAYEKICKEYAKISGREHGIFESYRLEDAKCAIVIMGATSETAKIVVDKLRAKGEKVGLLRIKLYRPFPYKEVGREIAHVEKIAVLDRAISSGSYPPLYQDILASMHYAGSHKHELASYVYGLGGRDTFQEDIEKIFENLKEGEISDEIKYIK